MRIRVGSCSRPGTRASSPTGYSTLYGDSAGGFAVIRDVPKTLVYRLCRYRNAIAGRDLDAAHRAGQAAVCRASARSARRPVACLRTMFSIPCSRRWSSRDESVGRARRARVRSRSWLARVASLIDAAEYKRRQSPPGVRITVRGFRQGSPDADHQPLPGAAIPLTVVREMPPASGGDMATTLDRRRRRGPVWSDLPGSLTLPRAARLLGGYRWVEFRLFEVLGSLGRQRNRARGAAAVRRPEPAPRLARGALGRADS